MSANDRGGADFGTWFDEYCDVAERAFLEAGADRVLSYAHSPLLFVGHERVVAVETSEQLERLYSAQLDRLRAQRYARTRRVALSVEMLNANAAIATVEWARYRSTGEEFERLTTSYFAVRNSAGWGMTAIVRRS